MAAPHPPGCRCEEKTLTITTSTQAGNVVARTWGIPGCLADQLAGMFGPPVMETVMSAAKMHDAASWLNGNALTHRGGGHG